MVVVVAVVVERRPASSGLLSPSSLFDFTITILCSTVSSHYLYYSSLPLLYSPRSGRTTPRGRVGGRGQHRLWDVVTPGRIPRGVVWFGLVWWSCGVRRWGGCGCGGLIGRVVWAAGWFLQAVPHPVVVWEVVTNTDCGMWSHRDGFPGVVWLYIIQCARTRLVHLIRAHPRVCTLVCGRCTGV